MDRAQIQRCEQVEIEVGKVGHRIQPSRIAGLTEARMVRRQHVMVGREISHERGPSAAAARAMQKQQRLTGALAQQMELASVQRHEPAARPARVRHVRYRLIVTRTNWRKMRSSTKPSTLMVARATKMRSVCANMPAVCNR